MAIICPKCGAQFDVTLFEFGHSVRCNCGTKIDYPGTELHGHVAQTAYSDVCRRTPLEDESCVSPERFCEVWRQGDDGNSFLVQDGLTEAEADEMVAEFESRGHKQTYWKAKARVG